MTHDPHAQSGSVSGAGAVEGSADGAAERYLVLLPVHNDWEAVTLLIQQLDETLAAEGIAAEVLIVDDGSIQSPRQYFRLPELSHIGRVRIIQLRRNLHHQRAITVGLAWAAQEFDGSGVIVMDADGEDDPHWVPRLIQAARERDHRVVVFAARSRRSESAVFVLFYRIYQLFHRALTGHSVRVGNFSVVPTQCLHRIVAVSETWNHYAAAVYNAQIDRCLIPVPRAKRLTGESSMKFTGLVIHGMSAISVFAPVVGVRLLVLDLVVILMLSMLLAGVAVFWALGAVSPIVLWGIALLLGQASLAGIIISGWLIVVLSARNAALFLPLRDYHLFIAGTYEETASS